MFNYIRWCLLMCSLVFITAKVQAQAFGGNPPSVSWRQVNGTAARIIFPTGLDTVGSRVALLVQQINRLTQPTIGNRRRKINIVLQNQLLTTNGYVALAPFISEFYLTPAQNSFTLGSYPVADMLAVHEYRHVQQINNSDVGLTRGLHILFGDAGEQLGYALSVPDWFSEGDAVYNETSFTAQGRGRLPYFFNGFKSIWAAGKNYSWMKIRNGSYRDYVPDWYPLGYMLTAYGRNTFGNQLWKNVLHDAASYRSVVYPFQHALKRQTGVSYPVFRTNALSFFKAQLLTPEVVNAGKQYKSNQHFIANQEFPVYADEQTLIYRKSSYKSRPEFIVKTGNTEKRIRLSDFAADGYFNYSNGKIVYTGTRTDPRWTYREYNELKIIDIKTGHQQQITHNTKYFAPAFDATANKIVVVEASPSQHYALHILNAANGRIISTVPNPGNVFYTYPKFYNDQQVLAAVRKTNGEMALALVNIKTGRLNYLTSGSLSPLAFPVIKGDTVYFTATAGKHDQLYAFNINKHELLEVHGDSLQHFIGNYTPAVNNNKLAWVSFSAYGWRLHETNRQQLQYKVVSSLNNLSDFGITALKNDSAANAMAQVEPQALPAKKYAKLTHPFNFHSLIPYIDDPDYTLSLAGQNILNTLQTDVSASYNRDEGYKSVSFTTLYGAWFPYLFARAAYIIDRRDFLAGSDGNVYEFNWDETQLQAGLQVPLLFNGGRNYTHLNFSSSVNYSITHVKQVDFASLVPNNTYLNNTLRFTNQIATPYQHIYPHLAQTITLSYRNTINNLNAHQWLASGSFYFPGLGANHSLVINAAYQQHDRGYSIFSNQLPFSRGYTADNLYQLYKAGINYHFPVAYPDAGFANLVYLLRLRGNLFYDYTHGRDYYTSGQLFKADFKSAGAELYFDTKWFNQGPITFGLRYSRLLDRNIFGQAGRNRFELVLPLSIF